MVARDGGCGWPTCLEPPGRCQSAHIKGWHQGTGKPRGPTDLANGILFCPYHHRRYDNDGWDLQPINGTPHLIPPTWIDPAQTPRRCGQRKTPG